MSTLPGAHRESNQWRRFAAELPASKLAAATDARDLAVQSDRLEDRLQAAYFTPMGETALPPTVIASPPLRVSAPWLALLGATCSRATTPRTTIHLVRHGEVDNPTRVLYGRLADFHLSPLGVQMAGRVAGWLSGRDIVGI